MGSSCHRARAQSGTPLPSPPSVASHWPLKLDVMAVSALWRSTNASNHQVFHASREPVIKHLPMYHLKKWQWESTEGNEFLHNQSTTETMSIIGTPH